MGSHWLDRYGSDFHAWREDRDVDGKPSYWRPLGLVETGFHHDGIYYEGRADINAALELHITSYLSGDQLRQRILLAWTALRLQHGLLTSKVVNKQAQRASFTRPCFVVTPPSTSEDAVKEAAKQCTFVGDRYPHVDADDFYRHVQNVARVVMPGSSMGQLFVLPPRVIADHRFSMTFLFVLGHQISDGLTNYTWLSHFLHIINLPMKSLHEMVKSSSMPESVRKGLPQTQEDLYPPILPHNIARQRWYWAITRVLRHVRRPSDAGFVNPLRFTKPKSKAVAPPRKYGDLLDYNKLPPLNTYAAGAKLSRKASARLTDLCRRAKVSIGAGCFTLVALVQMDIHERRFPHVRPQDRLPFAVGFPINPRPFYNHTEAPNSMMLAFCDGFTLPYLPSCLSNEARFSILARQAHRHMSMYQKRPTSEIKDMKKYMGSRGAGRIIAMSYLMSNERQWQKLPDSERDVWENFHPQGAYPTRPGNAMTNGISSLGRLHWPDEIEVPQDLASKGQDAFSARHSSMKQGVRARDGEFLVAMWGEKDGSIAAWVSYDGNAIDESLVGEWQRRMESFFEETAATARL